MQPRKQALRGTYEKMMFCQKCRVEYDESRKYCRTCGSPLSPGGEFPSLVANHSPAVERRRIVRICPRCRTHFEVGNYCRICGCALRYQDLTLTGEQIQEKKLAKRLTSEWKRLTKTKNELEICLTNLLDHREALSKETFTLTFQSHQVQIESLSCRLREIEARSEAIRKGLSNRISLLREEANVVEKKLGEIHSLYRIGALPRTDYSVGKRDFKQQREILSKRLRECRDIISQLPNSSPVGPVPSTIHRLVRYQSFGILMGIIAMIALGAYLHWAKPASSSRPQESVERSDTRSTLKADPVDRPIENREHGKIRSLFETIRRANLEKRIDLFMSCYASDFNERSKKRSSILETWEHFDYHDLSYKLTGLRVTGPRAQVRVEWKMKISPKQGGRAEERTSLLEVSLKKEKGSWKIGEAKPLS